MAKRRPKKELPLRRGDRLQLLQLAAESGAPDFLLVETAQRFEAYVLGKPIPPMKAAALLPSAVREQTSH